MEEFQAESLVIISLGAFILPLLAQRIKIPGIVLEIAYGITVGPILGIVETSEFISGLAILGFLLLMFLSGFEIELETFREIRNSLSHHSGPSVDKILSQDGKEELKRLYTKWNKFLCKDQDVSDLV